MDLSDGRLQPVLRELVAIDGHIGTWLRPGVGWSVLFIAQNG